MSDLAQAIVTVLAIVSLFLVGASIPAGVYCIRVYRQRVADNDLWRRHVRWIGVALLVSTAVVTVVALNTLAAVWPDVFEPLPRFWGSILILVFIDVLPLWVINTARTWKRLRRDGHTPNGDAP